jgi:hypothetical protein
MATDDELKATMAIKMWRLFKRGKTPAPVDQVVSQGIRASDRGRAKDLVAEMCDDDSAPIRWDAKSHGTVALAGGDENENRGWVRSWALRHGTTEDDLPWGLR